MHVIEHMWTHVRRHTKLVLGSSSSSVVQLVRSKSESRRVESRSSSGGKSSSTQDHGRGQTGELPWASGTDDRDPWRSLFAPE